MGTFPATFIQIHYHYRHGGVRQVMDRYARMCNECPSCTVRTVLVCSKGADVTGPEHVDVVDVPLLDYKAFDSPEEFDEVKSKIQSILTAVVMSKSVKRPAAVLFHNLSLGKNVAASAAFAETARHFGCDQIRFFPVLHDFAEEGRTVMLNQIGTVSEWGRLIYEDLYCCGAPVTFVVPGKQSFEILNTLDFPVRLLPNSVRAEIVNIDKSECLYRLGLYAQVHNYKFDSSRKVWYYPSRIIRRKNVLEVVFLSKVMDATLILGPEGISAADKALIIMLQELIQKYQLNVLINPLKSEYFKEYGRDAVSVIYAICDYAVTTSVAEGFGFGLYESYFNERPLLGRNPNGFKYPCDVKTDNLYSIVPVPAAFIEKNVLIQKYIGKFGCSEAVESKIDGLKNAEVVDFADLDIVMQKNLIERFMNDSVCRSEWLKILEGEHRGWPGTGKLYNYAQNVLQYNRFTLLEYFSAQNDTTRFYDTFSIIPEMSHRNFEFLNLPEMFQSERMTLLL